jgi:ribosomal protection tetracycline resistance protein
MKRITIGILAHVDAGKTTLSEALLYKSGTLRKLGRVDHGDAFLDTAALEREKGITIFSKQARLPIPGGEVQLLDTPGHVDFSAETERTLRVLDGAVVVVSGTAGVQGHTHTLWQLLRRFGVPAFVFVNKMDASARSHEELLQNLTSELGGNFIDMDAPDRLERLASLDDDLTQKYLETGELTDEEIANLIARREAYPCWFGSALRLTGVDELLEGLSRYAKMPDYPPEFGARVYKIGRDAQGTRLTYLKVTGGCLRVKMPVDGEKADQLRLYSGEKYTLTDAAEAGTVLAAAGFDKTMPGSGLGFEKDAEKPVLRPVFDYRVEVPGDAQAAYLQLKKLYEEDPLLHVSWDARLREIHIQLMGEVQLEILQRLILERFGLSVSFGRGGIVYRETILEPVEGVGHYEPLRHYAEVHLLLEPGEPGSGILLDTVCSEDMLARSWQRLIFTHLLEKRHLGVLTGSPVTDLRITILTGRAHEKHTEGGDFRQATYRAVRQGLKKAKSVLLEPWYSFRLELPQNAVGRAMTDLERMKAELNAPEQTQAGAVLTGLAPVSELRGYQRGVTAYTQGRGRLSCSLAGYRRCHNEKEVVEQIGYDSERDLENPTSSVFCEHGAGFEVKWYDVEKYAHLPSWKPEGPEGEPAPQRIVRSVAPGGAPELEKELLAIFERTYGQIRRRDMLPTVLRAGDKQELIAQFEPTQEFLLVDGYNILFAWDELKNIARENVDAARHVLMNLLCNYQAYRGCALILVFDAYRVPEGLGAVEKYHNLYIVYTKEAETADQYIERVTYELRGKRRVRVATSDALEQLIILGHGAVRLSAREFHDEVMAVSREISRILEENNRKNEKA